MTLAAVTGRTYRVRITRNGQTRTWLQVSVLRRLTASVRPRLNCFMWQLSYLPTRRVMFDRRRISRLYIQAPVGGYSGAVAAQRLDSHARNGRPLDLEPCSLNRELQRCIGVASGAMVMVVTIRSHGGDDKDVMKRQERVGRSLGCLELAAADIGLNRRGTWAREQCGAGQAAHAGTAFAPEARRSINCGAFLCLQAHQRRNTRPCRRRNIGRK